MGRQGISGNRKDAYIWLNHSAKQKDSRAYLQFHSGRMHSVGIGGQGFRNVGGSRSCPDAPEVCYRVCLCHHRIARDGNSRAPNKSWYQDAVGNQAEESEVGLRGWAMG